MQPACAERVGVPLSLVAVQAVCLSCLCVRHGVGREHSNALLLLMGNIPRGKAIPGSSLRRGVTEEEEESEYFLFPLHSYFLLCFYWRLR